MDDKRPKRRKEKDNPYTICCEKQIYYIKFKDGQGKQHTIEIKKEIFDAMDAFELEDIKHFNEWDRHIEQSSLSDEMLNQRLASKPEPLEGMVTKREEYERLHQAIELLPKLQRRRLKTYFFDGKTYEQIAAQEGCSKTAIKYSIDVAREEIAEKMKKFYNQT